MGHRAAPGPGTQGCPMPDAGAWAGANCVPDPGVTTCPMLRSLGWGMGQPHVWDTCHTFSFKA